MRPIALLACSSILGGVLSFVGGAGATPSWRSATRISPVDGGPSISRPQVATNPAGASVVVWERAGVVQAIARSTRTEGWSAPVDLSAGRDPMVALDAAGGAVVAYTKVGSNSVAQAVSRRSPSGDWEPPVTLSPRPYATLSDIAVNAAGDVVVGLTSFSGGGFVAEAAYRGASSPTWQPAVQLSDPNGNSPRGTAVAIDAAGNAVAVWVQAGPTAGNPVVMAAVRRASSGAWDAPLELAGPFADVDLQVAMDPSGNAVAGWIATRSDGPSVMESVEASFRPAGGGWTAPAAVSTPINIVRDLELVMDAAGNALAAWIQIKPGEYTHVQAASRRAGSTAWEPPADVTPPEPGHYASGLDLALDQAGNAVAAWAGGPVRAALRPVASGAWQSPVDVATPAGGTYAVDVAMDGEGNAFAVWGTTTTPTTVEASELDGLGPVFGRIDVPDRATARVPVAMSAEVFPWAAPLGGTPHWSFGDGTSADGATVRHVYAAAGHYDVSVAQSDTLGGISTTTRTIAVQAPTLANTARPSLRGRPRAGATLMCLPGSWAGTPPIRYAYAWLRDRRRVSTGPRRRLSPRDAGSLIACRVRATNPAGSAEATSRPLRVRR
jgi:hypothetical protein